MCTGNATPLSYQIHNEIEMMQAMQRFRKALRKVPRHNCAKRVSPILADRVLVARRGRSCRRDWLSTPHVSVRDFPEEGLQVLAHDGVENEVFGVTGLIRAMGKGHAPA